MPDAVTLFLKSDALSVVVVADNGILLNKVLEMSRTQDRNDGEG